MPPEPAAKWWWAGYVQFWEIYPFKLPHNVGHLLRFIDIQLTATIWPWMDKPSATTEKRHSAIQYRIEKEEEKGKCEAHVRGTGREKDECRRRRGWPLNLWLVGSDPCGGGGRRSTRTSFPHTILHEWQYTEAHVHKLKIIFTNNTHNLRGSNSSGRHFGAGKISHPKNLRVSAPSQTHQAHKIHRNPCKGPVLGTHFVFDLFPNTDAYIFTRILFFCACCCLVSVFHQMWKEYTIKQATQKR